MDTHDHPPRWTPDAAWSETALLAALRDLLADGEGLLPDAIAGIDTYREAGLLTRDPGLVLTLQSGQRAYVTLHLRSPPLWRAERP